MTNKILEHYGTKGMKWGVRKTSKSSGKKKGKSVKSMSDAELKTKVDRLNLEKRYSTLSSESTSSGQSFVTGLISSAAKESVKNFIANDIFTPVLKLGAAAAVGAVKKRVKKD